MHDHLQSVAAEVGLTMESRDVIINSRRALGAAEFARGKGRFEEMHHALFKAHWERIPCPARDNRRVSEQLR